MLRPQVSEHLSDKAEKSFSFIGRNKQNQKGLGVGTGGAGGVIVHFTGECSSLWSPGFFLGEVLKEMLTQAEVNLKSGS